MLTFVGCALTGLPLLFSDKPWAATLARLLGGFEVAGLIHRICAFVMLGMFASHLATLIRRAIVNRSILGILWGPDSMVPQPQDAVDLYRHVKWFVGRGPQPQFDRWTYWEKFDYWAVFWGMAIIGGSGLLLWFPVFFAKFLPGWMFNIASLVHGEEALLAVGFIFTIHFFNGHLRPERVSDGHGHLHRAHFRARAEARARGRVRAPAARRPAGGVRGAAADARIAGVRLVRRRRRAAARHRRDRR